MRDKTVVRLWILAVAAPLVCVIGMNWLYLLAIGRTRGFLREPGVTLMQAVIVALPFVLLAAAAPLRLRTNPQESPRALAAAAATGLVFVVAVWAWFFIDGYFDWKGGAKEERTSAQVCSSLSRP